MNKSSITILTVIAILSVGCFLCVAVTGAGVFLYSRQTQTQSNTPAATRSFGFSPDPTLEFPHNPTADKNQPTLVPQANLPTPDSGAIQTQKDLETTIVPIADLRDLAERLRGIKGIPESLTVKPPSLKIGDQQTFHATNADTNENFVVKSTLRHISDHLYFWIENGVDYNQSDLNRLADTFENKIYPTDREFFGSEWTPGVDNDPHLYILFAKGVGDSIAGYFSSIDEYTSQVHQYSNTHEMFFINADNQNLSSEYTYGVLAHEFQHMIHWYRDRNEETWMNEGFSVLAEFLNKYDIGGFDFAYTANPDLQLNDWSTNSEENPPHYGESFLFLDYFLDRFGETATKALVGEMENGLDSVDKALADIGKVDPVTHKPPTADDVFADWAVANYLHDPAVGDGRYVYHNYPDAPSVKVTEKITQCPVDNQKRDVKQYGVDYILLSCSGSYTLNFTGSTQVGVIPENAHSGSFAMWSNKGDSSDMTLTHSFDFSSQSGPLTLDYWTWYDLEKDYDFVYLEASEDGADWTILKTPSGATNDVSGNSFGWGYNGSSQGWIDEKVDLSQFSGKKMTLRFEYVTDDAVNGEGFLLDDISIPEINYHTDFESGNDGWTDKGFVRLENSLPQTYRVELITMGDKTSVQNVALSPEQTASIPIHISQGIKQVVLVVSGSTRFTRQPATYQFSVQP
jgi:immune inhibitor A